MKEELYRQLPETGAEPDMRQVFLYAAPKDADELPKLAEIIRNPKTGVKCLVKWMNPEAAVNETDLKNNLINSQVLVVLVTTELLSEMSADGLPLPVKIMQENNGHYFPVERQLNLLESYCALDRQIHGLSWDDVKYGLRKFER